jgi:hypothetical protein
MASVTTDVNRPTTMSQYTTDTVVTADVPMFRRISWGAVLAGAVVALGLQMALEALGLSIGAAIIDPPTAEQTLPQLGTAAVIWMGASALLSLFAGGYVAGRMAGTFNEEEGVIHGITVWAVVSLITIFAIVWGIGAVIGGVANVVGTGLTMADQGTVVVSPDTAAAVEAEAEAALEEIETAVQAVASDVADAVAASSGVVFAVMVIAAFAAGAGGYIGTPGGGRILVEAEKTREEMQETRQEMQEKAREEQREEIREQQRRTRNE